MAQRDWKQYFIAAYDGRVAGNPRYWRTREALLDNTPAVWLPVDMDAPLTEVHVIGVWRVRPKKPEGAQWLAAHAFPKRN